MLKANQEIKIIKSLPIKDQKEIIPGTSEVTFSVAGNEFSFKAGQYIRVTLPKLSGDVLGGNTRDFTIASSPKRKKDISIVFRNSDSLFKKTLLESPKGTIVDVQGPLGVFTLPDDQTIPIVCIAGGIGITPFLSMVRFVSENKLSYKIHIIYANSHSNRAVYIDELKNISLQNSNISITEKIGYIEADFIKENTNYSDKTLWYLCGVPEMTTKLSHDIPNVLDVPEENIRLEDYVGYSSQKKDYKIFPYIEKKITEIRGDEKKIQKQLLAPVLDAVGQAALVAITDVQGTILYINDKFIDVSKYSREELIGQNHRILKSGYHSQEFYKNLWETISSGKLWRGEIKNRAKDGSFYWVDTSITPIFNKFNKIEKYVAVRFLITDKKELEEVRKVAINILEDIEKEKIKAIQERDKLDVILRSIGDGVFVLDNNFNIILYNNSCEELSGFSKKEAIGRPYYEILHFVNAENIKERKDSFIEKIFSAGTMQGMDSNTRLVQKNGNIIDVGDSAAPIKDVNGNVIGAVVVFRDISKEKEIDKAKTEFISFTSHQLKTPLASINWQLETLLSGDLGNLLDEQKILVNEIFQGNKRMVELINSFLDISRIELGTFSSKLEPVDFIEVSKNVIKELYPQVKEKNITIEKEYESNISPIVFDPKSVRVIFQNLLSNAVKYTKQDGFVHINMYIKDFDLCIKISDNGYGIPKEDQSKIFSKLFRASNVVSGQIEGTGLGLYLVKNIVEKINGKIWFESEEGNGTTFYVTIPLPKN